MWIWIDSAMKCTKWNSVMVGYGARCITVWYKFEKQAILLNQQLEMPQSKLSGSKFRIVSIRYNKRVLTKLHQRLTQFNYHFYWQLDIWGMTFITCITICQYFILQYYIYSHVSRVLFNWLLSAWRIELYLHSVTSLGNETATGIDIDPYIRWVHIQLTCLLYEPRLLIIWPNQQNAHQRTWS